METIKQPTMKKELLITALFWLLTVVCEVSVIMALTSGSKRETTRIKVKTAKTLKIKVRQRNRECKDLVFSY